MMNMVYSWNDAKRLVDRWGWDGWMGFLSGKFPSYQLYGCSKDWYDSKQYICKARGTCGDIIVGWE